MKIYIGPPKKWWGPYQIANLLQYVGFSEDYCDKLGERLNKTWFGPFCEWFHGRFRGQKKVIKIHYYDTWSVDDTLAPIILPLLKQLRDTQHGSPFTDDDDVPEELRSTAATPRTAKEQRYDPTDANHEARWQWILGEMIWAFEQLNDPDHDDQFYTGREHFADIENFEEYYGKVKVDMEGLKAHEERIRRGTTLFGKYYQGLWD